MSDPAIFGPSKHPVLERLRTYATEYGHPADEIARLLSQVRTVVEAEGDAGKLAYQTFGIMFPVDLANDLTRLSPAILDKYDGYVVNLLDVFLDDPIFKQLILSAYRSATTHNVVTYHQAVLYIVNQDLRKAVGLGGGLSAIYANARLDRLFADPFLHLQIMTMQWDKKPSINFNVRADVPANLLFSYDGEDGLATVVSAILNSAALSAAASTDATETPNVTVTIGDSSLGGKSFSVRVDDMARVIIEPVAP